MSDKHRLEIGSKAPPFSLQAANGRINLHNLIGDHNLLIYFVREFGCHTCMAHALTLAKIQDELSLTSTRTILIGGGSYEAAQKVAKRYKFPFPVFGDPDRSVYHKYNFDKALMLVQKSGTVLIDKAGIIRYLNHSTNPGASLNKVELLTAAGSLNPVH